MHAYIYKLKKIVFDSPVKTLKELEFSLEKVLN
jgi:hypothetical protein